MQQIDGIQLSTLVSARSCEQLVTAYACIYVNEMHQKEVIRVLGSRSAGALKRIDTFLGNNTVYANVISVIHLTANFINSPFAFHVYWEIAASEQHIKRLKHQQYRYHTPKHQSAQSK